VDDTPEITEMFKRMSSKSYSEYQIYYGANEREMMALVLENKPHIIITDQMPIRNDFNALKRIREIQKEVPIILTSFTPSEELIAYADSINRYNLTFLPKPINFVRLKSEVNKCLNIKEQNPSS